MRSKVSPKTVRYIKLGEGGGWEADCLERGVIRFGFGSAEPKRFEICVARDWTALHASFLSEGKSSSTATRFTNEARCFFEDEGDTLWLTFFGEKLGWGVLDDTPAKPSDGGHDVWRPIVGKWSHCDINGELLTKDRLSGSLTKLAAYRGTSCRVDVAKYAIRRINGQKLPEVELALKAVNDLHSSVIGLMRLLEPKDFELLVDLVFADSGWRRLGVVGRTQETIDLDILLPSTGERAFVQVKSRASHQELTYYAEKIDQAGPYDRMFFVFHTGNVSIDNDRVTVIGPDRFAEMIVEAGMTSWLLRKVS